MNASDASSRLEIGLLDVGGTATIELTKYTDAAVSHIIH
jgi:hypothetical protein